MAHASIIQVRIIQVRIIRASITASNSPSYRNLLRSEVGSVSLQRLLHQYYSTSLRQEFGRLVPGSAAAVGRAEQL